MEQPELRLSVLEKLYKQMIDIFYSNDLTGVEIDTLLGMVWAKMQTDKLFTMVIDDVKAKMEMDRLIGDIEKKELKDKKSDVGIYK